MIGRNAGATASDTCDHCIIYPRAAAATLKCPRPEVEGIWAGLFQCKFKPLLRLLDVNLASGIIMEGSFFLL